MTERSTGFYLKSARWLFLIYIAFLPIVRPLNFRYLGIHILLTDLIFAAALVLWILSFRTRSPITDRKLLTFCGAFLGALFVSAVFSTETGKSFVKLFGAFYLTAVALMTVDLVQDPKSLKRIVFAFLLGTLLTIFGTLAGLLGYYLGFDSAESNFFLFHFGSLPVGNYPRVMSFFENPNMTANYLNISIMMILGARRVGWLSLRASLAAASGVFISALFAISAGLGGLIMSGALWITFSIKGLNRKLRAAVLFSGLLVGVLALVSTAIAPSTREDRNAVSVLLTEFRAEPSVRYLVWVNAIERGMEYPLIGRGTGTDAANVRYTAPSGQKQLLRDAHQAWLNIFGQAGIIGLATFVALCVYLISVTRFRFLSGSIQETLLVACSCSFVGAFLLQNLFGSFEDARHIWLLVGMIVGLARAVNAEVT